jgi:hypothetical protein
MKKTAEERRIEKELIKIETEKNQKPIKNILITIEWKKSRTWGHNPNAAAAIEYQDGTFERRGGYKCSGCGYDKESTVIADIYNDFLKYTLWKIKLEYFKDEVRQKKMKHYIKVPYGIRAGEYEGRESRYFDGGIGTSCYSLISEFIGGKFEHIASGETFDVYKFTA